MTRKPSGTKQNAGTKGGKKPRLKKETLKDLDSRGANVKGGRTRLEGRPVTPTVLISMATACC